MCVQFLNDDCERPTSKPGRTHARSNIEERHAARTKHRAPSTEHRRRSSYPSHLPSRIKSRLYVRTYPTYAALTPRYASRAQRTEHREQSTESREQRAEYRIQSTMQAWSTENRAENRSREQEQEAGAQRREHRATSSMSEVNKLLFDERQCTALRATLESQHVSRDF